MRLHPARFLVAFLVVAAAGCGARAGTQTLPADLAPTWQSYVSAMNGDDPAVLGAYFTDDAELRHGDASYRGRAEIVSSYFAPSLPAAEAFAAHTTSVARTDWEVTEEGRWQVTVGDQRRTGRYAHVWAHQPDGSWKLRLVTVTNDAPGDGPSGPEQP